MKVTEKTLYKLIEDYQSNPTKQMSKAFWLMDRYTLRDIRRLKDSHGNYLCSFDGKNWSIMGKRIVINNDAVDIKLTDFLDA